MKFIQKPGNVDNNKQESAEIKNDSKAKQPESKDEFSVIYEEIVNQLNSMEQQLAQNREKFLNNVKIKERENIILNGKLGLLEKNIRDYRLIKEQELKNFESESKSELSLFEKRIEEEFNDWNNKILLKEQEMEQYRNSVLVKTTGAQVNYQQKEREMKVEIGELQKQKNSLGNNLQHEKQIYELRVKNKDDEILKLKEEIAQKESEHTMEIEKYNISMDGMKHNWQQKMASIEEQFKNKCDELKETYSRKENELAMIKADFENKYKELNSEQTGKSRQLISLRDSVTVKIHDLEKRISQEVSLWEELLKQREDEYNKLKIDIVMKEAQNKKDVERMRELFLLEQQEIQQKIKLIENKYFQEKKNYEQMFELKDSEIENLKLESQLKMKELHEQWIIKQRDIFSEKKQLEEQLEVYRNKILAETDSWKKQVAEKNNEIESFKKEHENKQESIKLHY